MNDIHNFIDGTISSKQHLYSQYSTHDYAFLIARIAERTFEQHCKNELHTQQRLKMDCREKILNFRNKAIEARCLGIELYPCQTHS